MTGLTQVKRLSRRPEFVSHPDQVSEGICLHLLHDLPSMRFSCDLANAELATNLFVQQAGNYQCHNLPFTGCELHLTFAKFT